VGDLAAFRRHLHDQLRISSKQTEAGTIVLSRAAARTPATLTPLPDCLPNDVCRRLGDVASIRF
jgi:hypothetical protein